jgi:hypothetical protein
MFRLFIASYLLFALSCPMLAQTMPRRQILVADSSQKRIAIVDESGELAWQASIGPLHDLHLLDNGHILFQQDWTTIVEVDPTTDEVVWNYETSRNPTQPPTRVEIHAFQRLDNGLTMIAESGFPRIIEVDRDGTIQHELVLPIDAPRPHHDTRLVRKLPSGNYLVCHEHLGRVTEYQADGEVVWDYEVPLFGRSAAKGHGLEAFGNQAFAALRLTNGNTLISTGNGHGVIEVTPQKEIVWQLEQNDLDGIQLAWTTTLQQLPNGNLILGNCHAGPENPQVIELTRDKQVVWTFEDFVNFGNALTNSQVLTMNGERVVAKAGVDR